ncbi:DNA recombination protein RmuC [Sulfurimonas sp.]|uniref:DNA recombination protein RmuC n=1 Tax=Sulfurimonas sp. TaxID=2022749 RepID=UPI003569804D
MDIYLILLIASGVVILILAYLYLTTMQEKNNLQLRYAVLNSRYEEEIKFSKEKLDIMQNAKKELSQEFKLLANQIFEDKSKKFDYTHKKQFEMLLRPFREQITNFSMQSREQFTYETKERHLLKDELLRLKEMNEQLSQEALNLTNALKGDNKAQGNWGEIVLERILEESGLRRGFEYETQTTLKSSEGNIYRPDVIVHLPEQRDIIIDSKVSLVAYERFMSENNPEAKAKALREHILSISSHIKGLSSKKYDKLDGINTLDFVLLFMPIEGAFLLALEQDGEFFKRAYDSNILVVSPSTLLVTLRTVEHIWRTQRQEDHAKKIALEAEAMYEKLVLFVEEMQKIGSSLQKAQDSYDTSMKRLKTGKGNIIKRAENMVELGLKPKKSLNILSEDEL